MRWIFGNTTPKDRPVLIAIDACRCGRIWRDEWKGWVICADGFDARDHHGEIIVVDAPDYWCDIPDVVVKSRSG